MRTLSVVIPVYNEEKYVGDVVKKVAAAITPGYRKEIIIIDDGSTDSTYETIKKLASSYKESNVEFKTIRRKINGGKGAALKDGFRAATGDILMVQDADEEYSTKDYPALIEPFAADGARVVYGSRNKKRENFHNRYSYLTFYVGGLVLTWFINALYGTRLTDQATGYKLFSSKIKELLLQPSECRFSYEVAVTALLAKSKIPFHEVPIHYKPRTMEEGKKINFGDFIKSVVVAVKYKF